MIHLVTGAAGFIGSHLCNHLLNNESNTVIAVDNLSSGNAQHFESLSRFGKRFIPVIIDVEVLSQLDFGWIGNIDRIWHLACQASPPAYQKDMLKTLDTCYLGTRAVLNIAKRTDARILFTSTSEVYGDPLEHPQTEEYRGNVNTFGIRSCYDEGKRVAESLCFTYSRQHGVDIRIARIFNTYGPGMSPEDGRVITNYLSAAQEGRPLEIFGDGSQTRSFCYIDDTLFGLLQLMNCRRSMPVNIGNDKEFSILELANIVNEMYGNSLQIIYKELPCDDPVRRKPDLTVARKLLDFYPRVSLEDGLKAMATWMKIVRGR